VTFENYIVIAALSITELKMAKQSHALIPSSLCSTLIRLRAGDNGIIGHTDTTNDNIETAVYLSCDTKTI
jgi:hypothetical protein